MTEHEPVVVGFLCNWCSYQGADAAGRAGAAVPAGFRPVRVMCTGRIDPAMVLRAFREGADGVLILGCRPGECHYRRGNVDAAKRFHLLRSTLAAFGIDGNRLRIDWVSAAEGERFAEVVNDMFEALRGKTPLTMEPVR